MSGSDIVGLVTFVVLCSVVQEDAFWGLAVIIVLVCSLPLTAVTAIVTDNLMDKYAEWRSDRQGSTTNKGSS